jgi:hypothetical protein
VTIPVSRSRRHSRLLVAVGGLVGMLVLGLVGWSGWFRVTYGSFPGLEVGQRITWCGHDFHATVTDLTRDEADDDPTHPLVKAFAYPPVWHKATVFAAMRPAADLAADPTVPCAPELYVRTGNDRFTRYLPDGPE